jgi:hypothetical protein
MIQSVRSELSYIIFQEANRAETDVLEAFSSEEEVEEEVDINRAELEELNYYDLIPDLSDDDIAGFGPDDAPPFVEMPRDDQLRFLFQLNVDIVVAQTKSTKSLKELFPGDYLRIADNSPMKKSSWFHLRFEKRLNGMSKKALRSDYEESRSQHFNPSLPLPRDLSKELDARCLFGKYKFVGCSAQGS